MKSACCPNRSWASLAGVALVTVFGLAAPVARAQSGFPINWLYPYVDYSQGYDSNIFRTPDDLAGLTRPDLSDTYRTITTGLVLQREIGRQVLSARLNLARNHFDRLTFLDNDSRDFQANWNWRLGSSLSGNLGTNSSKTLTPFTESHDQERNLRTQLRDTFDVTWEVLSNWDIQLSEKRSHQSFDLQRQQSSNRNLQDHEIAINYWGVKPSRVGLILHRTQAQFPINSRDLQGLELPNGFYNFDQLEAELRVDWYFSRKTSLHFRGGRIDRRHELFPIRNFSGNNASLRVAWAVSSRFNIRGQLYREIGSVDNLINSYTLNRGRALQWDWNASSKIRIDGTLRIESRDYLGVINREALQLEQTRSATLGLTYVPWQHVQLGLAGNHERLQSNFVNRAYRSNGINANVRYQF
ncbi:MAG: hypothetical protein RL748_145 [Pseudomonadota bacterium]